MSRSHTKVRFLRRGDDGFGMMKGVEAAASLHCHTHFSREVLSFIPWYAEQVPIVATYFREAIDHYRRESGRDLDFGRVWWTPPVTPGEVIEMERLQVEMELGLPALISITDHDEIEAGLRLQVVDSGGIYPISLEWTVPWGQGFFHLGVHNLPAESAIEMKTELMKYTEGLTDSRPLSELLEWLNRTTGTMLVLNHPFWDIELIGEGRHRHCLGEFLTEHGGWLHALEVNGYRSWKENRETLSLAEGLGLPVVSGGDRHGCQPNSILNLTRSTSFEGLVGEIREDGWSEVLLMPAYGESRVTRLLETVAEVIGHYPGHAIGRETWSDRVFFRRECGRTATLSEVWPRGGPGWVRACLAALRMLGSRRMRPALRLAFSSERRQFEYEG